MGEENQYMQPLIPAPYLPPKVSNNKQFTLVLDLDETLIHYIENV